MKQISQNYRTGKVGLDTVAAPALKRGGVLVQTQFSVISIGTEGMKVREARMSYVGKARARPDQVKKVVQSIRQQGLSATYQKVMNKLDSLTPLGYSTSGVVVAVAPGAEEFRVGDRVACAGAGYANHGEINFVPKNLAASVPNDLPMEQAAFATVGAIALQGLRQAELQLGETTCVIGLGLLGQLTVQMLRASGVHVIGVDVVPSRCTLAESSGAAAATLPDDRHLFELTRRLTNGMGVDCVVITAGGNSNSPVELAAQVLRDRGRVVDVGKTKLELSWNDYYLKEIDLRFSRSYGPGRYDPNYEEGGIDYPIGYVRWTEKRNMQAFLALAAQGALQLEKLIDKVIPFEDAVSIYNQISSGQDLGLGLVFRHAGEIDATRTLPGKPATRARTADYQRTTQDGIARIGVIGAGSYASSMLLPYLSSHRKARLVEVATATSLSAADASRKFNFTRFGTDYEGLLGASDIDAVLIATPHSAHAAMTADALNAGKTVYVEKPLAIDMDGLTQVLDAIDGSGNDRLFVGFNRRFSSLMKRVRDTFQSVRGPLFMHYRVHAGQLEPGSWYLDAAKQGSRFIGEAGHFFDVFDYLTDARPFSVVAKSLRPNPVTEDDVTNIAVVVEYENGSIGNLLYLTQGDSRIPKEHLEVFGGGKAAQLHNFERVSIFDGSRKTFRERGVDKGQKNEVDAFVSAVANGQPMPIPLQSIVATTVATLATYESLRTTQPVEVSDYWPFLTSCQRDSARAVDRTS